MRADYKKPAAGKTAFQKIKNALSTLIFLFAVALLALTAFSVLKAKDNPKGAFLLGYKPAVVETGSMSPWLLENSMALIKKTDFSQVAEGDVITYELDGQFITHRVISKTGNQVIVKGDTNASPDPRPVTAKNFVGMIVWRMNWMAPPITGFKANPTSAALCYLGFPLAAIALIVFIVAMTGRFVKAGRQEKKVSPEENMRESNETRHA